MEQQQQASSQIGGKRWFYAIVGVIVMLFAGFVYAWSILSGPIGADFPAWSNAKLSLTFTICMAFFCLGGFAAGNLAKKVPIRVNVLISAALFLVGFFLASKVQSLGMLYVSYGVLCGTASGFAYNAVMSTMPRWFPNSQGLISGVLLMGFGSSSMIIGAAFTALTPGESGAWRQSFLFMGVLMAVVLVISSFFFQKPAETQTGATKGKRVLEQGLELAPSKMVRRASFWLFFLWAILVSGIGLAVISQAKPMATMIGTGAEAGVISLVVGLISVCNGLGRVIFGAVFDRLGRKRTMPIVNLVSLGSVLLLLAALMARSFPILVAGFVVTGLAYGGAPTMVSAFTSAYYGQKNYPVNFSIMNMNLMAASFAGTAAGALFDASGSYFTTLVALAVCAVLAFIIMKCIKKP